MSRTTKRQAESEPVRVLGRGLRAERGVRLTMRTVRQAVGKTQSEVAKGSRIDQADISRLESREDLGDCQVSTLRRYVETLGGRLELVAAFGNKRIILSGAQSHESAESPAENASQPTGPSKPGR